jgi:hypothetical protein
VFNFSFIAVEDSDLSVILTDSSGNETRSRQRSTRSFGAAPAK